MNEVKVQSADAKCASVKEIGNCVIKPLREFFFVKNQNYYLCEEIL